MANIRELKDFSGNRFYPLVHARGVVDSDGNTLEEFWHRLKSGMTQLDAVSDLNGLNGMLAQREPGKYFGSYVSGERNHQYMLIVTQGYDNHGVVTTVQSLIIDVAASDLNSGNLNALAGECRMLHRVGSGNGWGMWTDDLQTLRQEVANIRIGQSNLSVDVNRLDGELSNLAGELRAKDVEFAAKVAAIEGDVANLQAMDSALDARITALDDVDRVQNEAIESLQYADSKHDDTLRSHTETLSDHESRIDLNTRNLESEVKRAKDAEAMLEGTIEANLNDLTARIEYETEEAIRRETEIDQRITDEINRIKDGVDVDFDTLKEIADWINEHGGEAAAMLAGIQENEGVNDAQTNVLKRLDQRLEPVEVTLTGNGGGVYERGAAVMISLRWSAKKGGASLSSGTYQSTVDAMAYAAGSSTPSADSVDVGTAISYSEEITAEESMQLSKKTWNVKCEYKYELLPKVGNKEAVSNTVTGNQSVTSTFVGAKYVGASTVADAASLDKTTLAKQAISRTPAGSYKVTASETSYLWIVVPEEMTISGVTLNGFAYHMEAAVERDGYRYYRGQDQMVAGTYTFVVSGTGI